MANKPVAIAGLDVLHTSANTGVLAGTQVVMPPGLTINNSFGNGTSLGNLCYGAHSNSYGMGASSVVVSSGFTTSLVGVIITRATLGIGALESVTGRFYLYSGKPVPTGNRVTPNSITVTGVLYTRGQLVFFINSSTQILVQSNGTTIATLNVPGLVTGQWYTFMYQSNLDATAGYAAVMIDGITVTSATNLNTVSSISLSSTTTSTVALPWVNNAAGGACCAAIDDLVVYGTTPPTDANGNTIIATVQSSALSAQVSANQMAGYTGSTQNITNLVALTGIGDGKTSKAAGAGSSLVMTPDNTFTAIASNSTPILGIKVVAQNAIKFDGVTRKLALGVTLGGTDDLSSANNLATTNTTQQFTTFTKPAGAGDYLQSDFAAGNIGLKLLIS